MLDGLGKVLDGLGKVLDDLWKVLDGLGKVSDGVGKVSGMPLPHTDLQKVGILGSRIPFFFTPPPPPPSKHDLKGHFHQSFR